MARKTHAPLDNAHAPGSKKITAPTLIDVAKVAGVSPITVSRALHRPEVVSKAAREKVMAAVQQVGYVSNMLAGSLASNRSRLVAILLPTIANSIFADTVQALMDSLATAGYQTLLGLTGYSATQEERLIEALLGRRPDGIVLTGTLHTAASRQRLAQSGIPVVESWDLSDDLLDMQVGFSHEAVGQAVARHLLSKGYERYAVVGIGDPRGLRRCDSLIAELHGRGVNDISTVIFTPPATLQTGRDGLRQLFEQGRPPQVVVCTSDTVAQGVLAEAASRHLRVPEDLAVMGFGDLSSAAQVHPALSTVRIDGQRIGEQIARVLLERFRQVGNSTVPVRIDTGFSLIDREST